MIEQLGKQAKDASRVLALTKEEKKNHALTFIANALRMHADEIIEANAIDLAAGESNGLTVGLQDRLRLDVSRIQSMAQGVLEITKLPDPAGRILSESTRPNGLRVQKVSVPIGVIGVIFEARPNVTSDAAALCLKSGNAVILRGGKEAIHSNTVIVKTMRMALEAAGLPADCIQLVEDTSRESSTEMMQCNRYLDLLIPRGGAGLIRSVVENATVPVIETGTGNCHIYIDKAADVEKAISIVFNAKTSRPSVCNSAESLLIHSAIASDALPAIKEQLDKKKVILYGDDATKAILPEIETAQESDWGKEYLDYQMSVKIVDSVDQAIAHINRYGTGHSECIVTENHSTGKQFLDAVDAAAVYVNASTRFTDGGVFGFGAEIGISTQKLHARGPIGLPELNSYKYKVFGDGQIR